VVATEAARPAPKPAASQPSMGSNLREMRRPAANLRIDVEDPYK
jgi:hypothetical protein